MLTIGVYYNLDIRFPKLVVRSYVILKVQDPADIQRPFGDDFEGYNLSLFLFQSLLTLKPWHAQFMSPTDSHPGIQAMPSKARWIWCLTELLLSEAASVTYFCSINSIQYNC